MSNTVRVPRKRPREASCAWTTFGWLLRRTAAMASYQEAMHGMDPPTVRDWFRTRSATGVARYVAALHFAHPDSRFTRGFRG